jgi:selenocysteine lyase/cysteine desulfurase
VGVAAGGERARSLAAAIRDEFQDVPRFRVLDRARELAAIVTVEVAGRRASGLVRSLRDRKINSSATFREWAILDMDDKHATSAVRISPHYYNTEEEVATVVEALKEASS